MKVLVTRPRKQSAAFGSALQMAGFEPVYFPVIEIRPVDDLSALDAALAQIEKYAWVVFTSVNGVEIVFDRVVGAGLVPALTHKEQSQGLSLPHFVAVGTKTAEALRRYGIEPFFVPEEFTGDQIGPGLGDLRGKHVLLPQAELARKSLPEAISAAGGVADVIVVYRTLPTDVDAEGLSALKAGVDWLTFTSPSTLQNFAQVCRQNGLDPLNLPGQVKIACIGPVTEKAAREEGFIVDAVAAEFTTDGLIKAIADFRLQISDYS